MSQIDKENESIYDLPNNHFRIIPSRDGSGEILLYVNIAAVGGTSRRSLIPETFHCVVDVRVIDLPTLPVPFLNRFEKFRLSLEEVTTKVKNSPFLSRITRRSSARISDFFSMITLIGFLLGQYIETLFT